jgi:hypothetical protein
MPEIWDRGDFFIYYPPVVVEDPDGGWMIFLAQRYGL